ncbi:MAG TPA: DUF3291 domain-containing protein [Eudoraea sp.]|nr:DUF3291 domain-containing protein [Eudoraea sp.]
MKYHLAQINIARMLAPIDSDIMADFVNNLDRINALAEQSEGFVWRLAEEGNNATTVQLFDHEFYIVNMSVWTSVDALFQFTYKTAHVEIFKRRKEWFSKMQDMHMALWYVEAGTIPSTSEAKRRLDYLNANGESPYSFTFKRNFTLEESLNYKPVKC